MSQSALLDPAALSAAWCVLDARSAEEYQRGHWPGAVRVPVSDWEAAARQADTDLAEDGHWRRLIGNLGIDGRRPVAVYDDGRMTEAARVWFILQHFGVPAAVLDGGWPVLSAQPGGHADSEAVVPTPVTFSPAPIAHGPVGLIGREELRDQLGTDTQVFDARTAAEFVGKDLRKNARGGHLPGARRIGHTDLLTAEGRLKSPAELRAMLERAGFQPGRRLVTHCDGGGRAALAALAAVQAGFTQVDAYYLSFADWAKDEGCPLASGLD
ncbi:rhodanese-like domain-containing protein [Methylobacterium sp.]|uniref:sulfurtransferase n=1 Tax=Methylobacterium sp. TaxID=409 RepID=UPI000C62FA7C|nr:rhodanese-like domain-containing protein [Methylobacterium sp.]MBP29034.1 rhodanese family protein [Methylobacterium sp.]